MIALLLTLVLSRSPDDLPQLDRGSELYKNCRATIRIQDGKAQEGDYPQSSLCIGYIDGFTDGLVVGGNQAICVAGASLSTLARVYVSYMENHPKEMDVYKSSGLTGALLDSYLCPNAHHK